MKSSARNELSGKVIELKLLMKKYQQKMAKD